MEAVLANILLRKRLLHKIVGDEAWERARNHGWVSDDFEAFQRKRHGWKVEAVKALRAWWARRADRVIVPSRYLARWVSKWGVLPNKVITVHNAVHAIRVRPAALPLTTTMNIATAGRLVSLKRVDNVMIALAPLQGVGFVIVGDGPELQRLRALAINLRMDDRVYFAGARARRETLELMAACDVFVLNSIHEGFPHVVLEAMALGLPVIATAVGGNLELIEDGLNGRLIPSMDVEALRRALADLLSTPSERRRLARGARESARAFDPTRMVDETITLLASEMTVPCR
jgi:glycosyltransferase involved in cell wall biosynthesis